MSRALNLISLIQAKRALSKQAFTNFQNYHDFEIKDDEIADLGNLCEALSAGGLKVQDYENFYVGYKIPQIGKEFDLLRIGKDSILNIEVKRESTHEKILAQLRRNSYYLSFIDKEVHSFAFVAKSSNFFKLNELGDLLDSSIEEVVSAFRSVTPYHKEDIDSIFNPSDYLVSPFNSTERFIEGKYFLTGHQEEIFNKISKKIRKGKSFSAVSGGPGTGKTLLVYHLAKKVKEDGKKCLIVHCGSLNSGHEMLIANGFSIVAVKNFSNLKDEEFDLIILDEAQRIWPQNFEDILKKVKSDGIPCVFSHDGRQTLHRTEAARKMSDKIGSIENIECFSLSEKIRTNAEIAEFIKVFLNRNRFDKPVAGLNITINYFKDSKVAQRYWESLPAELWNRLRLTSSQYNSEHHEEFYRGRGETTHSVIGQEFDGVAILIDNMFSYNEHGDLIYKSKSYYDPMKMIFQNITRTRRRLNVVIVDNEEILAHCMKILGT